MTTPAPAGTTTTHPPAGVLPFVPMKPAAKVSQAVADQAAYEIRAIDARLNEMDTQVEALLAERMRLQRIMRAAGVDYQHGRQTLAPAATAGDSEEE